jgi:hypothetical protein
MLEKIKLAIPIKSSVYDQEILDLIEACKIDLMLGGVNPIEEDNPIIIQAIKFYCKANFGKDPNSERFKDAYEKLKIVLGLADLEATNV